MIYLNFNLRNPWSSRFQNIKSWHGHTPIPNKFWELQIYKSQDILDIQFELTHRQSHAGLKLTLGLFGYNIEFTVYDNRHWDSKTNTWEIYEENLL